MRDPIMRAFSEWSMFALGWFWEKNTNFEHKVSQQMRTFRECNTTLFHDVEKLKTIPPAELEAYLTKCFRGRAMEYVSTSVRPPTFLLGARAATSPTGGGPPRPAPPPPRRRAAPALTTAAPAPPPLPCCCPACNGVHPQRAARLRPLQFLFLRFEDRWCRATALPPAALRGRV